MATVGQQLLQPESGWKRYDGCDSSIFGKGSIQKVADSRGYNSTAFYGYSGATACFRFTGTKVRIIGDLTSDRVKSIDLYIDGIKKITFSQYASEYAPFKKILNAEVSGLSDTEHCVRMVNSSTETGDFLLDAVDVDDTGELKLCPLSFGPTNLTAAPGNSQITLSWMAVDGATGYNVKRSITAGGPFTTIASNVSSTNYVDSSVINDTTYYYVVTAVTANCESNNSNEASALLESKVLLRITMNDSSEKEYNVTKTAVNNFVKWCDRTVDTGSSLYKFDDVVDKSQEYLLFEKIISFKVIQMAQ